MLVSREKPRVKLRGNSEDVTVVLKKDPEKLSIDWMLETKQVRRAIRTSMCNHVFP